MQCVLAKRFGHQPRRRTSTESADLCEHTVKRRARCPRLSGRQRVRFARSLARTASRTTCCMACRGLSIDYWSIGGELIPMHMQRAPIAGMVVTLAAVTLGRGAKADGVPWGGRIRPCPRRVSSVHRRSGQDCVRGVDRSDVRGRRRVQKAGEEHYVKEEIGWGFFVGRPHLYLMENA
jgi:hypothetical protein